MIKNKFHFVLQMANVPVNAVVFLVNSRKSEKEKELNPPQVGLYLCYKLIIVTQRTHTTYTGGYVNERSQIVKRISFENNISNHVLLIQSI